ncbi:prolyl endopeptidase-like [Nematostella vectensis]|uniref:prolyl endopeptidase-like n=1 Tax=Nematostella vectensis TaxID=45351 RepID=UPI0020773BE8|nr:prolyl endopeptidase-like [Nematostella vectensis]XP_032231489.2 prolyl endopeptidase-like [Nematostella vectensis]
MLSSRLKPCYFRISRLELLIRPGGALHVSFRRHKTIFNWIFGQKESFPLPKRKTTSQLVHGLELFDELHWLQYRKFKDVKKYIAQENKYTQQCLEDTSFFQRKLVHEMSYWLPLSHELESVPERVDDYVYYMKCSPDKKKFPVACRRQILSEDGYSLGKPQIIFNQNELPLLFGRLPSFSVSNFKLSPSRKFLMFILDTPNAETPSAQIIKVWDGPLTLVDSIPSVANVEWGADDGTIYYTTINNLLRANKLWRHKLKTEMVKDELVFEEKHERYYLDISSTKDRTYLTINSNAKTTSEVCLINLQDGSFAYHPLYHREVNTEYYIEHRNEDFFILSNDQGKNYRVVRVPHSDPSKEKWKDLIPVQPKVFTDDMEIFSEYCVVYERDSTVPRLSIVNLSKEDSVQVIKLPKLATMLQPGSNQMFKSDVVRYTISSPVLPPQVIDFNMKEGTQAVRKPVLSKRPTFPSDDYKCTRLEVPSQDGTLVPVTLFHHEELELNGHNPMLMHVYGAYGVNVDVGFRPEQLCLLTRGWVLAFCHVRGGGELGREWYHQAILHHKHRSFEDFEACTAALQRMGYSSPPLTAARGVSAGGLVVGAVCNRSPELFKAVIMKVPFLCVLTSMLDPTLPLTSQEYDEWGDPRSSELDLKYIKSYCPYHNISSEKRYPDMLVSGSIFDDRVPYWVPLKYVAKLRLQAHDQRTQNAGSQTGADTTAGSDPMILCSIDQENGHFGSGHVQDSFEERAEEFAFLHKSLGLPLT